MWDEIWFKRFNSSGKVFTVFRVEYQVKYALKLSHGIRSSLKLDGSNRKSISSRTDNDKIYLHVKDPFESKYQLLFNKREKLGIKKLKNQKAFIEH